MHTDKQEIKDSKKKYKELSKNTLNFRLSKNNVLNNILSHGHPKWGGAKINNTIVPSAILKPKPYVYKSNQQRHETTTSRVKS